MALSPDLYKLQVTLSRETMEKLRRVQDLLRHTIPSGDPAAILDHALTLLLVQLERRKVAATDAPRSACNVAPGSRHIPAAVRRAVWARDGGQCAVVGAAGRCTERGFLEFHHVALGTGTLVSSSEKPSHKPRQRTSNRRGYQPSPEIGRQIGVNEDLTSLGTEFVRRCS
jgi:hypothetical protein